ncbi:MAG: protein kinase domain-containing protein, partial [Nannocystaceae bacterium]
AVAEAIAYAHSQNIIHRDLKPQNILVGSFGETVVIDWGLAKDLTQDPASDTKPPVPSPQPVLKTDSAVGLQDSQINGESLTLMGTVMGTPSYMPPEQAIGLSVDERADVYALGAILYHVLAGRPPYTGNSPVDVLVKVTGGPPPSLTRIQRKLPDELVTIVDKAMARSPEHRYRTASDFADDLRRFQTGKIVGAHNYSAFERLRRFVGRYRAPLISLALLAVMGAVGISEVVQERDLAEQGRREAEQARAVATEQRQEARTHSDQLTLEQARIAVKRDPSRVLKLLSGLSPGFQAWDAARMIAADARAQGLPVVLRGHTATTTDISFSHDGKTIFSASDDGSIREWNLETGHEVRTLADHTDEVWVLRVSEDGRQLLSAGKDRTLRLWDLQTGTAKVFEGHRSEIFGILFLDNNRIVSLAYDETVRVWDTNSREVVATYSFYQPEDRIFPLIDWSQEAHVLMYETTGGAVGVRNFKTGETWTVDLATTAGGARIDATGTKIALTSTTGKLYAYALTEDRKQFSPVELDYDSSVAAMGFEGDNLLVQDGRGGRLVFFNLTTGSKRQIALTLEQLNRLTTAPTSPTGERWIAAGAGSGVVYLVDSKTGTHRTLRKFQDSTLSVEFSRDSTKVAATSPDHTVRVWDVQTPSHSLLSTNESPIVF